MNRLLVTLQVVYVLERQLAVFLWTFELPIVVGFVRMLLNLMVHSFFFGQKFCTAVATSEVARMHPNMVHIIFELGVALKAPLFNTQDLNIMKLVQML